MNLKQRRFVLEYLVDGDGTHAALRAGYRPGGAEDTAMTLLRRKDVRALVAAERRARAARTGVTAERVLALYAAIAFADIRRVARRGRDRRLRLRPPAAIAAADALAIAEIDGDAPAVRLFDKEPALAALARFVGLVPPPPGGGPRGLAPRRLAALARARRRR